MSNILVYTESKNGEIKNVTLEILGRLSGHTCDVAHLGTISDDCKKKLAENGANKIVHISGDNLDNYSSEGHSLALKSLIDQKKYDFVFSGATAQTKDFFPRLSALYDSGMLTDITEFELNGEDFSGTKPLFAGKCLSTVKLSGPKPYFVTVRPNALGNPESSNPAAGEVEEVTSSQADIKAIVKEVIKGASEKLDLTEANVIVSGGRAMKNSDNFKILDELADVLGATVGASRAAVDAGYAEHSMQVGQTGKTVSPTLYIACGISGAIQHLAGMRTSKVIVAINSDAEAPIMSKADYAIVGDLFQIIPILTEELKTVV